MYVGMYGVHTYVYVCIYVAVLNIVFSIIIIISNEPGNICPGSGSNSFSYLNISYRFTYSWNLYHGKHLARE